MIRIQLFSLLCLVLCHQITAPMETCTTIGTTLASHTMPYAKVFAAATASALGYGIVHTAVNSAINFPPENLLIFFRNCLQDGFSSTWKPGLALGAALAAATQLGPWPRLEMSSIKLPLLVAGIYASAYSLYKGYRGHSMYKNNKNNNNRYSFIEGQPQGALPLLYAQDAMEEFIYLAAAVLPLYILEKRYSLQ